MSHVIDATPSLARPADRPAPAETTDHGAASPGGDWVAWLASFVVHLSLMAVLGIATFALPSNRRLLDLVLAPEETVEPESLPQEFVSSDELTAEIGALSAGGTMSALAAAPEFSEAALAAPSEIIPEIADRPAVEIDVDLSSAPDLSQALPVQGAGSIGVTGSTGAIDRLTHEILASLEQRPTMVVWLFDQSGSLRDERAKIVKRFRRIYEELGVIEAADNPAFRKHEDKPLLTAVVGFGAEPVALTPKPTDRIEEIERAITSIEDDETGQENVFTAVTMAAEKYRAYMSRKQGQRRVMLVVFTDEAGDDYARVDDAVATCRKFAMPVYVVGRPAPFGRETAYVKWIDPDPRFDQRPQWVPVTLGPESLLPESLKLRFAGGGEEELLDSGFGPFALTRLCYDTGGLYFSTHPNRVVGRNVSGAETSNLAAHFSAFFDSDAMRRYQPDYVTTAEYLRAVQASRARRALVEAARLTWTSPLEDVRLRFPKRDEAELAQLLTEAQRAAAVLQPKLDMLCQTLLAGEADREAENEPRWQAGFDLALGRALAAKVRADGYNVMLAEAKQGMAFREERNNTWLLRPGDKFAATNLENLAEKARLSLERVTADHPGTPWAMLAKRELTTPLGWRWGETFTFLPPRVEVNVGNMAPPQEPMAPQGPPRRNPPPL